MRFKLPEPDSIGSRGIDEPLQFVWIVNIGHEALRHFRNCCRQWYTVDEAATGCVAVEAAQGIVLTTPVTIHRTGSSQKLLHAFSADLGEVDVHSHAPTKRVQQAVRTFKISAHRLPKRHVVGD